jgi:hypothetical protein
MFWLKNTRLVTILAAESRCLFARGERKKAARVGAALSVGLYVFTG